VRRFALALSCILLAGCSRAGGPPPLLPPDQANATRAADDSGYHSLYIFTGKPDGSNPVAPLTETNGAFWGTTMNGGGNGLGSVFTVTPAGKESIVYSFAGPPDGEFPQAGLISVNGTFYGTTNIGGANDKGSVFEIGTSGKESVLYSFKGGTDGERPTAGLLNVRGTLYGTTTLGGNGGACCGTVFALSTSGEEHVIYRFKATGDDGDEPKGGLISSNGEFYGTTEYGGTKQRGTVFAVDASGKERILHSFKGAPSDGAEPVASVITAGGKFYGTTSFGGTGTKCGTIGCGTVFELSPSGSEKVLYSLKGGSGGSQPHGSPLDLNGALYVTAYSGGDLGCRGGIGCGTILKTTTSGVETLLYTFEGGKDGGAGPEAGLIDVKGTLYGTTIAGGMGDGTVFTLTP
jgi:uncharacterized repeat protein (TIGR03803 family)